MPNILWTSHRGFHQQHVENTMGSFTAAVRAGFTSLETDLRTTLDGHIVLHHDAGMSKTSGEGKNIHGITIKEFKATRLLDGQHGMDLQEFMDAFGSCQWIFDIKPESAQETIDGLQSLCDERGGSEWLLENTRFLLWSRSHESYLKSLFPKADILANEWECHRAGVCSLVGLGFMSGIEKGRAYALPPKFLGIRLLKKRILKAYRSRGAKVIAYLPEGEEELDTAILAHVDEILTNGLPRK